MNVRIHVRVTLLFNLVVLVVAGQSRPKRRFRSEGALLKLTHNEQNGAAVAHRLYDRGTDADYEESSGSTRAADNHTCQKSTEPTSSTDVAKACSGRRAVWDEESVSCKICGNEFKLLRRKHHCRR